MTCWLTLKDKRKTEGLSLFPVDLSFDFQSKFCSIKLQLYTYFVWGWWMKNGFCFICTIQQTTSFDICDKLYTKSMCVCDPFVILSSQAFVLTMWLRPNGEWEWASEALEWGSRLKTACCAWNQFSSNWQRVAPASSVAIHVHRSNCWILNLSIWILLSSYNPPRDERRETTPPPPSRSGALCALKVECSTIVAGMYCNMTLPVSWCTAAMSSGHDPGE